MNAIELMAKQLTEHPDTSNGVVLHSYRFAQHFIRRLLDQLDHPQVKWGHDLLRFHPTPTAQRDWWFTAYVDGSQKILGSRITGLLLIDVNDVSERYWMNTALPIVMTGGEWLPINGFELLDKEKVWGK